MGFKATQHVWRTSKQSGSALVVLLAIADHVNDATGEACPGVPRLAAMARLSDRGTQKVLQKLSAAGEIEIRENGGVKTAHGSTNCYRLSGFGLDEGVNVGTPQEVNASSPLAENAADEVNAGTPQEVNAGTPLMGQEGQGVNVGTPQEVNASSPEPLKDIKELLVVVGNCYTTYEDEKFGSITPVVKDDIDDTIQEYGADEVLEALKIAALSNKRQWAYVHGILRKRAENQKTPVTFVAPDGIDAMNEEAVRKLLHRQKEAV